MIGSGSHVVLVDGSGYMYRAYHALPPLHRRDGMLVNGIFGFTGMLLKLIRMDFMEGRPKPTHIVVALDLPSPSFRRDIDPNYKAHRTGPGDDLRKQLNFMPDAIAAFNITSVAQEGFEADDLIATYAREAERDGAVVTIVGSDKDLYQLIGPSIAMYDPVKFKWVDDVVVKEKFGVGPELMTDLQGLVGDTTDNIPGIPGIGPKMAAKLLKEYGSLEQVIAHVLGGGLALTARVTSFIADHWQQAELSKRLATLCDIATITTPLEDCEARDVYLPELLDFCRVLEFETLAQRIQRELGQGDRI